MTPERIAPRQVRREPAPLLVCAYEDEDTCRKYAIDHAITLQDLRARLPDLPEDERIIFYCN